MRSSAKLNVVLFALTGFGNTVFKALLEDARVNVASVFTVKYANPFPYYREEQLLDMCEDQKVPCYYGVNVSSDRGIAILRDQSPDLIIMATFKQILKRSVLCLPSKGVVNIHPSLLPCYRGSNPTNAALYNNDEVTGVTIHFATEELDAGNILVQWSIPIDINDSDGPLREKLARLAGEMIPELIGMFDGKPKPAGTPQTSTLASIAPRPTQEDGYLELADDIPTIVRKMRAFNPLPGTSILVGDRRVAVDRYELLDGSRLDELRKSDGVIDLIVDSYAIRLHRKRT